MKHRMIGLALVALLVAGAIGCKHNLPPAQRIREPGPGVAGPGPGVMNPDFGMLPNPGFPVSQRASQFAFMGPDGMHITWDVSQAGSYDSEPLVAPGRQNFGQNAIYRLELSKIPGREGVELYPTLEVAPANPRTEAYLAHSAIPIQFTEEDLDQVNTGNFVTKVIYLPDGAFQELAIAGVETLVSTRLEPGVDPIVEADRRGSIMAIVRLGNKDEKMPGDGREMIQGNEVVPAGYNLQSGYAPNNMNPAMMPAAYGGQGAGMVMGADGSPVPMAPIAGLNMPMWGMPMSGTPIGLPGPPHIPHGTPAGLRKHVMVNHTHRHIPKPTHKMRIDVKQSPGMSYPKPVSRVRIHEKNHGKNMWLNVPFSSTIQHVRDFCTPSWW